MKKLLIAIILLNSCSSQKVLNTNYNPVMIDGNINKSEWADSKTIDIQSNYTLYLKQDSKYYYLAIKSKTKTPFYVDMFVFINQNLYNIHSSSQKGERILTGKEWTDRAPTTNWGYINNWTSNTVKFDRTKMRKLKKEGFKGNISLESIHAYDGFEHQFLKEKWKLNKAKIRIEMRNMVGVKILEYEKSNHILWFQ